jgi:hypothetical protein
MRTTLDGRLPHPCSRTGPCLRTDAGENLQFYMSHDGWTDPAAFFSRWPLEQREMPRGGCFQGKQESQALENNHQTKMLNGPRLRVTSRVRAPICLELLCARRSNQRCVWHRQHVDCGRRLDLDKRGLWEMD